MTGGREPWKEERMKRQLFPDAAHRKFLGHYPDVTREKVERALKGGRRALELIAYTDGASRGNPGPAGIGVRIQNVRGDPVDEVARAIGKATNNEAEYIAVITAVRRAIDLGATSLVIRTDSELVARHLTGEYKVKSQRLRPLYREAVALLRQLGAWRVESIPRQENREADRLANRGIDEGP